MKIFFINPPLKDLHFSRSQRSPGVIKSGTMYYPYWLAHSAALCEKHGHEINLLDCPADGVSREEMLLRIDEFAADLVVMDTSTPSIVFDLQTVEAIRKNNACKIALVGTHVTSEWHSCLQQCDALDYIAVGEYDYTIVELAEALEQQRTLVEVAGLAIRDEGKVVKNDTRLPIHDLDELPWIAPLYDRFLTPENYLFTIARQPMVMLIGGRGCRAKCFYCVYPQVMHGHQYRTRSLEHLVGEMKWIQENMPQVREIVFEDDTFTADKKRAQEFAEIIKREGITLPWFANIRTNTDRETLHALKDAGLRECATGFESGDDLILANMRKGQTVEKQKSFMKNCRELGLLVHGCFMVGFPGETKETLQATLDLALELNPDSAQFYPVMPYPGTGAYQWAKDNNFLSTNNFEEWVDESGAHRCVLNLPDLSPQKLEEFCEYAFRKYHFRPKYLCRKILQAFSSPKEGKRSVNAGLNFIKSLFARDQKHKTPTLPIHHADETWRHRIKVPHGRMEEIELTLKQVKTQKIPIELLQDQLRESESKTERRKSA